MVEVFKTNIQKKTQSKKLLSVLAQAFPLFQINFDLSDCDRILRVEGDTVEVRRILTLVNGYGVACEVLE